MDFRRIHPDPATVDSAELLGDLRLHEQVDALVIGTRTLGIERYGRAVRRPELRAAREALGLAPEPLVATVSRSGQLPLEIPLFQEPDADVVVFAPSETPE